MQEVEARRLEELGSRLRSQRQEADERKKEREIKVTDTLHLPKRPRTGWGATAQPKSLFQKTRSEASKIQRTMYSARVVPPMPVAKTYAQCTKPTASILLPSGPQTDGHLSRVTVNTVKRPVGPSTTHKPPLQRPLPTLASSALGCDIRLTKAPSFPACAVAGTSSSAEKSPQSNPCQLAAPPHSADLPPRKPATSPKKDPMACLFLPKQRVRPTNV